MFSSTANLKVYVAAEPCDMRKSFDGLHAQVQTRLESNPQSGALFVFFNKKRTIMKVLYWDGTGLWILGERLEEGTFSVPLTTKANTKKVCITPQAYQMLTQGIELKDGMTRAWYEAK